MGPGQLGPRVEQMITGKIEIEIHPGVICLIDLETSRPQDVVPLVLAAGRLLARKAIVRDWTKMAQRLLPAADLRWQMPP